MQRPDATRVAGFNAWLALGYCVRRGETGLRPRVPCPPSKAKLQAWRDAGADPGEKPRTFFRLTTVFDTLSRDRWEENRGSRCSRLLAGGLSGWKGWCCRERLVRTKRGP